MTGERGRSAARHVWKWVKLVVWNQWAALALAITVPIAFLALLPYYLEARECRLHMAAGRGDVARVQALLREGVPVNERLGRRRLTPLHYAASLHHTDSLAVCRALIYFGGADIDPIASGGGAPIHVAMGVYRLALGLPNTALVRLLIGAGSAYSLHGAVAMGDVGLVLKLLAEGADPNKVDSLDRVPMAYADRSLVDGDNPQETEKVMTALLIAAGAKIPEGLEDVSSAPDMPSRISGARELIEGVRELLRVGAESDDGQKGVSGGGGR